MADEQRRFVPPKTVPTDYPVIDTDPHVRRAFSYARNGDWAYGAGIAAIAPGFMLITNKWAPTYTSKGTFPPIFRLSVAIGAMAGALAVWQQSSLRLYGWTENNIEVERDMREMVDKVKRGEPLYGESRLSPYMQGVAARNSRYSAVWAHVFPMFNFVNHNQHGVDTSKYYQQAERELEAERLGNATS